MFRWRPFLPRRSKRTCVCGRHRRCPAIRCSSRPAFAARASCLQPRRTPTTSGRPSGTQDSSTLTVRRCTRRTAYATSLPPQPWQRRSRSRGLPLAGTSVDQDHRAHLRAPRPRFLGPLPLHHAGSVSPSRPRQRRATRRQPKSLRSAYGPSHFLIRLDLEGVRNRAQIRPVRGVQRTALRGCSCDVAGAGGASTRAAGGSRRLPPTRPPLERFGEPRSSAVLARGRP